MRRARRPAWTWEASTGRLLNTALDMQSGATHVDAIAYTYDPAGQITSISDVQHGGGTAKTDTQCFTYDYLQRLTQAWKARLPLITAASKPSTAPKPSGMASIKPSTKPTNQGCSRPVKWPGA
ncbi:hypothetical protein ACIQCJ_07995 [Streptomyces sp. NPDC093221]|uniref:hypothetical protein n=1 Tax=Streptomyces sp. NPDC093221 TaxID=3366032 RepID=UPI00382C1590